MTTKKTILSPEELKEMHKKLPHGKGHFTIQDQATQAFHYVKSKSPGKYEGLTIVDPEYASTFEGDIIEEIGTNITSEGKAKYVPLAYITTSELSDLYTQKAKDKKKELEMLKNLMVSGKGQVSWGIKGNRPPRDTAFSKSDRAIFKPSQYSNEDRSKRKESNTDA